MKRRTFTQKSIKGLLSYALLSSLVGSKAVSSALKPNLQHWSKALNEYCLDLGKQKITQTEWQHMISLLYRDVELNELLKFIDFERLIKGFQFPDLGVNTKPVKFPKLDGLPANTIFLKKIFGLKKDRAIIPHGHSNMTSAHLVLKGDMRLRHYEKIGEEHNSLIIKPTIDRISTPGDYSSISDEKDNIHWFIANSPTAFTFDIIMLDLNEKPYDIHNIDIQKKQPIDNELFWVPTLDVSKALEKYGKVTHH